MAKVLLVEDDNNLREIYQARLMAEGYDIVTAQNGEEALVVAKQNKPDLIISDVMMPRISGFEMLDILRNTNELKNTKVIMLTALGQDDDQKRASNLGANRYLVKSQVTLEDIVNAAKELLSEEGSATPAPAASASSEPLSPSMVAPAAPGIPAIAHVPDPAQPLQATVAPTPVAVAPPETAAPVAAPTPAPATTPAASVTTPAAAPIPEPAPTVPTPAPAPMPAPATPVEPPAVPVAPSAPEPTPAPEQPMGAAPAPTIPMPTPAPATTPAAPVDTAAQGLEAEEAALQAQIASYAQETEADADAAIASQEATANASNDQALADAVQQLNASSQPPDATVPTPAPAPMPAPATPVEPPAVPVAPSAPEPTPAPDPTTAPMAGTNDNVTVSGKKVIQPISDPTAKPDLDALLAKEEAASPAPATPSAGATGSQPPAAHTPGQTFDPSTSL